MATHSSILAWGIPWTEEPGGLQSMECEESDMTDRLTLSFHDRGNASYVHLRLGTGFVRTVGWILCLQQPEYKKIYFLI